jgi:S-adenosylmethionine:tRNA ribosyltransferase-isomerase
MAERTWTTADFDFDLPNAQIAQHPTARRGESRLLVVARHSGDAGADIPDGLPRPVLDDGMRFDDIIGLFHPGDVLVVNATRVRHARFIGTRPSGSGTAEVLLIHPAQDDTWIAMGRPGSAMRPGRQVRLGDDAAIETIEETEDAFRRVRFVGLRAEDAIAKYGRLPLPPYITRDPTSDDDDRYQTVYATRTGSVAAPTAGLHFTPALLDALRAGGVVIAELDLEVGPGTFRPVEAERISEHTMHAERFEIPEATAQAIADCRSRGGKVWAVGTTVVRALESAAMDGGLVRSGRAETSIMITPGFSFRAVDHLITNFHLPRSTLLMLVAAFAGYDTTMAAYRHAVATGYRFYSYGDAMCVVSRN